MNLHNIIRQHLSKTPNAVFNALTTITLRSFLMGIGYGTANQIKNATPEVNDFDLMVDHFDDLVLNLLGESEDPFIVDVIDYIDRTCFEQD